MARTTRGKPIIAFRLPPDEIARVKTVAERQDLTVSEWVRRLVRDHLDRVGVAGSERERAA